MLDYTATEKFKQVLAQKYTGTTLSTGNINWFVEGVKADKPLVPLCMNYLTSSSVGTVNTFDTVTIFLSAIANWSREIDPKASDVLREVLVLSREFRDDKEHSKARKRILRSHFIDEYLASLTTGVQKLFSYLGISTGAKPQDFLRDVHKFSRLSEGVIEVGKKTTKNQTLARRIEFDGQRILEFDPEGEATELVQNAIFGPRDVGLATVRLITPILRGTLFNCYELRASHAINMRLAGSPWIDIAHVQGVQNVDGLRSRMLEYAAFNDIQIN